MRTSSHGSLKVFFARGERKQRFWFRNKIKNPVKSRFLTFGVFEKKVLWLTVAIALAVGIFHSRIDIEKATTFVTRNTQRERKFVILPQRSAVLLVPNPVP
jgi:hypothetical protein